MARKRLAAGANFVTTAEKADLAALKEIGYRGGGFTGIAAATGNGEDEIAERELRPVDFADVFFHKGNSGLDWDALPF